MAARGAEQWPDRTLGAITSHGCARAARAPVGDDEEGRPPAPERVAVSARPAGRAGAGAGRVCAGRL